MNKLFLGLLATLCVYSSNVNAQATQVTVTGSSSTNTISNNVATAVDPALVVNANGNLTDFIVSITDSYTAGDLLDYTGSLPSGVSATAFNVTTRSLVFTGTTSAANWQDLLRRVTLRTTSAACFPERRSVAFTVGNKYYNPLTGHFYEYVSTLRNWVDAKTHAATQSYFGRQGYLATSTSAAENNFVWKIMTQDVWVGGTYDYNELISAGITAYANQAAAIGKAYWVTGPERGTFISSGLTTPVAQNGQYMNWTTGEPNNYNNTNEYYIQLYSSNQGLWNDLPISSTLGALIEYGGMPADLTTSTVVSTRNIYVNGAPSGTVSGGGVAVCSGTNSTTLTISGFTGTVQRWESSLDNFLTPGTAISNTTNSYTVSNITQTTYYRAVVNTTSPATCTSLTTSSVPVYVTATVAGNPFSTNTTICPGASAALTLYGNSGSVLKWQVSTTSNFSSVTDISNTTTSLSYPLASAGTYYFRAQVQNSGCGTAVFSAGCAITVTSGTPPVGGSASSTEHCSGSNSGSLTLTGYTGTIQKWQYSIDGGIIWTDIASSTSATYNYSGITSTRLYRAVVSNGSCGTAFSSIGTVYVYGNTQYQWLGTTSTTSSTSTNWKCNTIPPAGADIVISNTATNDLVLDQNYIFGNIDFAGSNRKVVLGNFNLTVNSLTGTNSNNFVRTNGTGKLKQTISNGSSKSFAVGNSAYNPVTITNNSGNPDDFAIIVLDEVYTNGSGGAIAYGPRVKRTWDITKTNANGGTGVSFVFNWNSGEATNVTSARMFHYQGGAWVKQTGTTSSTSTSLTYTGYTGTFSPFAVGDNLISLPLTWLSFTAKEQDKNVVLNWSTAFEENTKDFTVQYSTDGNNWSNLGILPASGNNSSSQSYSYIHPNAKEGMNYYRIVQSDKDGRFSYSKVTSVYFSANTSIMVYPNPVTDGKVTIELQQKTMVRVFSSAGKLVLEKQLAAGRGELNLGQFAKGIYMIKAGDKSATILIQ